MVQPPQDIPPNRVVELVVNLDDASGERLGLACSSLLAAGALDVWTTAITMKQGRPGAMLSLLAAEDDQARLSTMLLETTGSFGVRSRVWDRLVLERSWEDVETRFGPLRLKVGRLDGRVVSVKPEFADVAALAQRAGVAVSAVQDAAAGAADALRAAEPAATQEGGAGR